MKKHGEKFSKLKRQVITILPLVFIACFFVFQAHHAHAAWLEPIYKVLKPPFAPGSLGAVIAYIWDTMMKLVNSLVLIALVYVAFMNILRIQLDSYAVKKILPTFIMAVILANFSFLISRIVIDIGNVAISIFLLGFPSTTDPTGHSATTNQVANVFNNLIQDAPKGPKNVDLASTGATSYAAYILSYIVKQWFLIAGSILVFILSFIFLIRNYMLYFLVAIAPVAFMAMILPITKKYFQMWWSNMFKWTFMPVVSVFWLWLAGQFMYAINARETAGGTWILPLGFAGLCFYMAITSPFKIGGAVVGAWAGLGKKAWGATGGKATKWAGQEAKERASDAALRARLAVARTKPYQKTLGDKSAIGQWRTGVRSARAERRLRLEGPQMVREKQEKDARIDAAYNLANDKRTPSLMKKRMVSLIRTDNLDERKTYDNWGLKALLDDLKFNTNGTLVTSGNNDGSPTAINKKKRYTDTEGMREQMAKIEQIKYLLRRRNQLDPTIERPIADNLISGNAVTINGVPRTLEFLDTSPVSRGQPAVRNRDIRRLDPSGFASSAVPLEQIPTQGAPAEEAGEQTPDERTADLSRTEELLEQILEKTGRTEEIDKKAADAIKPTGLGVGAAIVPEIDVRIKGIDPAIAEQLRILQTRVAKANGAQALRLQQQQEATLQTVAQQLKSGQSPEEIEKLVAQGQSLLEGGDVEGARNIALQINPAAGPSLDLTQKGSTHE